MQVIRKDAGLGRSRRQYVQPRAPGGRLPWTRAGWQKLPEARAAHYFGDGHSLCAWGPFDGKYEELDVVKQRTGCDACDGCERRLTQARKARWS